MSRFKFFLAILAVGAVVNISLTLADGDRDGPSGSRTPTRSSDDQSFLREACALPPEWARYVYRGWNAGEARDWDLAAVPVEENWFGSFQTTSHSGPYPHLQEVPLVLYGPGFIQSRGELALEREVTLADLPATYSQLMDFDWPRRDGSVLEEVLKDSAEPPRLIVTLVIDGGGWNVLETMPDAWPNLAGLIERGSSIAGAVVGSSPSITPAVHTTLATGTWPSEHGVMAIVARADDGAIVSGFSDKAYLSDASAADPTVTLDTTTLADDWDLATDNAAEVAMVASQNFHLGMIGHGSSIEGADKDIAAMTDGQAWATNPEYFSLPDYINAEVQGPEDDLETVDLADGQADGKWRGHGFFRIDATPAYSYWETRVLKAIIDREGFGDDPITDLFYINYKAPDAAGHKWNMIGPEQRDVVVSVDEAIAEVVDYLDVEVGSSNYVLVVTADHGQTPLDSGGWPISQTEVKRDVEEQFDQEANGRGILQRTSTALYFMDRKEMETNDVMPEEVASFLTAYTIGDNLSNGADPPEGYEDRLDERVFSAVIPGRQMTAMAECTGALTDLD